MERKKPDKHQYATPISSSSYIYNLEEAHFCQSNNNMKDSLFFKYASSIIHVVPEDKLDLSSKNGSSQEQRETIFEISQVNDFQVDFFSRANPVDQEQNNYNNIAAKMKKKTMNKKLLAYNFSNFTIFIEKIDDFGRKQLKHSLEALRLHSNSSESIKTKKEIKRASFYSGYTTSTSNQQLNIKKNSKKLMEQKKREDKKEAANRVKGFIEYKMLMNYNQAFQDLREYVQALLKVSDVSTVKNGNQILQNFYLTQPNNDHSISIVRELDQNISSSLVYTADHNFQFTQKEVTLTTPEKFESSVGKFGITEKHLQKPAFNSHQQSFVQTYRPKDNFSSVISPRKFPPKDTHTTSISKPIAFNMPPQRRHLIIRTNCYELPLLSDHYLTINREKNYKDLTVIPDHCTKNEPETFNAIQAIVQQLSHATNLLGNSQTMSNKSIENSTNTKNANIFSPKISKLQSINSKYNVDKSAQNFKLSSQFKSTFQTLNEKKQGSDQCQNYYFLNRKNQELQKIKSNISPHKIEGQSAKVITSDRNPSYALSPTTKESIKKSQKIVRFHESTVSQIKFEQNNIKVNGPNKLQLHSNNYNIPREERKQIQQNSISKNQRIKSRSKINLVMQSPQREAIQKPMYSSPRQIAKQQSRIQYNYEKNPRINSPYSYGAPVQRPKVSAFKEPQPARQFQPQQNYKEMPKQNYSPYSNNIYQMNHKPAVTNINNKPTLGTPQKVLRPNQNTKRQYQYRVENQYPQPHAKMINPTYMVNNLDKRHNVIGQNQQRISREESAKKPNFYSPQVMKDPYLFSPQKVMVHQAQEPQAQKHYSPLPNNYIKQQYFANSQGRTQQLHKAVNFNNNYYTNNTPNNPIRQTQVVRNVFKQQERPRTNHFKERPPSNRPPQQRVNIFSNYSPLDSQLESQQRSNHFSKNSSQLSRPKSMNEKIFITLRKDK